MKKRFSTISSLIIVAMMVLCASTVFAASANATYASGSSVIYAWPTDCHKVSGKWGRQSGHASKYHYGIDIPAGKGAQVKAAEAGTVYKAGLYYGYGYTVIIKHRNGQYTLYAHNKKNLQVKAKQKVKKGTLLAYVGGTGSGGRNVYFPHCHFGIYKSKAGLNRELRGASAAKCTINPEKELNIQVHQISYDLKGGEAPAAGAIGKLQIKDGDSFIVSQAAPTKKGYRFKGWYLKRVKDKRWLQEGSEAGWYTTKELQSRGLTKSFYAGGKSFTMDSAMLSGSPKSDYIFYAKWGVIKYTVSYDMNGGRGSIASQKKTYGKALKLSSELPVREGYTFLGWAAAPDAAQAQYQPGDLYKKNKKLKLYAVWQ